MALYEIDIIDPEPFEAVFYFNGNGVRAQADVYFFAVFYTVGRAPFVFPPEATF